MMNDNSPLAVKILELINIIRKSFDPERNALSSSEELGSQFSSLYESILNDLLWSPGILIYLKDPSELKAAQATIDLIWKMKDSEQILAEITGGGYSGLLVSIIGDYADRFKMLKPTFVSIRPDNTDFNVYFNEAMKAWLFGLDNASLILCFSILEAIFKQKLPKKKAKSHTLETLIDNAKLNPEEKEIAHSIRKLRNDAVHGVRQASYKETYEALLNTKKLVEKLLSPVGEF